jgi:Fungal specific transcription factor domain
MCKWTVRYHTAVADWLKMYGQLRNRQRNPSKEFIWCGPGRVKRSLRNEGLDHTALARLSRLPEVHPAGLEVKAIHEEGSCDGSNTSEQKDELLAIGATLMNDILSIGPCPPLTSSRKKMGAFESVAIDFYINAFAPSWTTPLVTMTGTLDSPNPCLSIILPTAMQHEELYHSIVALSFSSIESLSFLEAYGGTLKRPSTNVLYHRLWALKFLREKLTSPNIEVDDAMLLTTIILIAIDAS